MRRLVAALLASAVIAAGAQAAPRKLYIAADDHTDYVWSSDEAAYSDYFVRALDTYLDQIDATSGGDPDQVSRWNVDGTLWLQTYERSRTPAQFNRLMDRVRDGSIGTPLNTLVSVHGGTPWEGVLRDMYYAGRLERRFNLRIPLAIAMENHTASYGLTSLWAGSGARYSWKGVCEIEFLACSNVQLPGVRERDAFWAQGPDGARILFKWYSAHGRLPSAADATQGPGGYAEARWLREAIPIIIDGSADFAARWPYDVIGLFGAGWDDPEWIIPLGDFRSFPGVAADLSRPDLDIRVSNIVDFFADFEARYGATLPVQAVSFGNEWEVNAAAFAAKTARVKRAIERLRAAEAMAAIVSLSDAAFMRGRERAREDAFTAIGLFYEHNVGGGGNFSSAQRSDYQERQALRIEAYVDRLHEDGRATLGRLIPAGAAPRLFALNPLGYERDDIAEAAYPGTDVFHLVDLSTGRQVASETIGSGADRRVRWFAETVPPLGYKVFEVRPGAGPTRFSAVATYTNGTLVSARTRVSLDDQGRITRLVDRRRGERELITAGGANVFNRSGAPGTVTLERIGPVSATMRADLGGAWPRSVRVTLLRNTDRVEVENRIDRGFDEVTTYAFNLALASPLVRHGELGAVLTARLAPEGNYSPRSENALYEWLSLNHFVHMADGSGAAGVTISASDSAFFRLGNSTLYSLDTSTPRIEVLAGGRANGWTSPGPGITGTSAIVDQGGDTRFRFDFALQPTAAFDQRASTITALAHQNPLVTGRVEGTAAAPLPPARWNLLSVTRSNLLAWAVKPAEDGIGSGVIVRVWNQSGVADSFNVKLGEGLKITGIPVRTSHIETDLANQTAARTVPARAIATYRLQISR